MSKKQAEKRMETGERATDKPPRFMRSKEEQRLLTLIHDHVAAICGEAEVTHGSCGGVINITVRHPECGETASAFRKRIKTETVKELLEFIPSSRLLNRMFDDERRCAHLEEENKRLRRQLAAKAAI